MRDKVFSFENPDHMKTNGNFIGCRVSYVEGGFGPVSQQLYSTLTSLQMGLIEDKMNWTVKLR